MRIHWLPLAQSLPRTRSLRRRSKVKVVRRVPRSLMSLPTSCVVLDENDIALLKTYVGGGWVDCRYSLNLCIRLILTSNHLLLSSDPAPDVLLLTHTHTHSHPMQPPAFPHLPHNTPTHTTLQPDRDKVHTLESSKRWRMS